MSQFDTGIPNIRVVLREAVDENILVDVPTLVVKIERSPEYNVNITPSTQVVFRTGSLFSIAEFAYSALSASYADTIKRQIAGDVGITGSLSITDNVFVGGNIVADKLIVSSSVIYESGSTKFGDSPDDTHQFTGSVLVQGPISASGGITGSFKGDGSQLTGLVTDLRISGSTGSDTLNLLTDDLSILGNNGITATVTDNTVTIGVPNALTASLFGTASWATIADNITVINAGIYQTGSGGVIIPTPSGGLSYITSASYALTASYIANNTWNNLLNIPAGLVSSSVQVYYWPVQNAVSASFATSASWAPSSQGITTWDNVADKPAGLVSSSAQATTWTVATASRSTTSSFALTASYVSGAASTWDSISGKPSGLVSSSTQATTWTVATASLSTTSSFTVSSSFATSSSRATTSSFALTASFVANASIPTGTVSSSTQVSNYNIFATTGSNTFVGNQTITGSLVTNADTLIFTGSIYTTGSISAVGTITGSLLGTSSWASSSISSSYALTASYAMNGGSGASDWDSITNKPAGLVSSSAQINTGSFTGSFTGQFIGTSSWANYATTASYISGGLTIQNGLEITGSLSVSQGITGSLFGTSSWATYAITASYIDGGFY